MIQRIIILIFILILLPEFYSSLIHRKRHASWPQWRRLLRWLPATIMLIIAVWLALPSEFIPEETTLLFAFVGVLCTIFIPRFFYMLSSIVGRAVKIMRHGSKNWGNLVGFILAIMIGAASLYGFTIGPNRLKVKHIDITSSRLPEAFDGYRILHFTDIHLGSARQSFVKKVVDSICSQHADMVAFTGDLLNVHPNELYRFINEMKRISAPDGVFSVLGNHDYSFYQGNIDDAIRIANEREVISREQQMGWTMLNNSHTTISRGNETIVVAGMENYGKKEKHRRGDINNTLEGAPKDKFTIMLEHDPWAWRNIILPDSLADVTLSGHTHGGQISLYGLRPTMLTEPNDYGLHHKSNAYLNVSSGTGGLVPFRLGMTPEIVVITLHSSKKR